jgi:hypothetical protein
LGQRLERRSEHRTLGRVYLVELTYVMEPARSRSFALGWRRRGQLPH